MTTATTHQIVTHATHPSLARRHAGSVGPGFEKYPRWEGPHSLDAAIGALAGRQHGVVSWAQLRELGVPRHAVDARVQAKRLYRLHRGVYAVGHEALTWRSHLIAAVYACGSDALASHRAAGALQGMLTSGRIEVTAPRARKPKPGITLHRTRLIHPEDRTVVAAVPTTSIARTLVDLADVLTEERLAKAVDRAEILRVFDLHALQRVEARLPGRRGRHRLERVLAAYQPEPRLFRSDAERRLKELCERHSLPQPQFNVNLHGFEVDAYWPEANLALEVDGAATHHTRRAFHEDRRRDRALAARGVQSLRVTTPDLGRDLMEQVRAILRRR
jgi:very-short-patch-repair endonuclease